MAEAAGFHFERVGADAGQSATLILLHGSGSSEHALIGLAHSIAPDRAALALQGRTPSEGGYAFFRRNPDRTLDHEDLAARCAEFCDLLSHLNAADHRKPLLVGYSNGAIMAAAAVIQAPELSSGAILLRPLSPRAEGRFPPLADYPVLLLGGALDQRRGPSDTPHLAEQFRQAGAAVTAHVLPVGHGWEDADYRLTWEWLKGRA
jgi:phospholipase/carboxylesterase